MKLQAGLRKAMHTKSVTTSLVYFVFALLVCGVVGLCIGFIFMGDSHTQTFSEALPEVNPMKNRVSMSVLIKATEAQHILDWWKENSTGVHQSTELIVRQDSHEARLYAVLSTQASGMLTLDVAVYGWLEPAESWELFLLMGPFQEDVKCSIDEQVLLIASKKADFEIRIPASAIFNVFDPTSSDEQE